MLRDDLRSLFVPRSENSSAEDLSRSVYELFGLPRRREAPQTPQTESVPVQPLQLVSESIQLSSTGAVTPEALAQQVNERTPANAPARLALIDLLRAASESGTPENHSTILRLANSSDYLRQQIWSHLTSQHPAPIALMVAILSGADSIPANPIQALERLPDEIRRGSVNGQRASEVLIAAAQLQGTDSEPISQAAQQTLRGLLGGLTQATPESRQILLTLAHGAIATESGPQILSNIGRAITSEPVRRQFVELLRSELRESPEGDHTRQQRLANCITSLVNGLRPRGIVLRLDGRQERDRDDNAHVTSYLGTPSAELLTRVREGDRRAQLELETFGMAALPHLRPTNAGDRQVFARIAARQLVASEFADEFTALTRPGRPRSEDNSARRWDDLLSRFAPPPGRLLSEYTSQEWRDIQSELQRSLVAALRERVNGSDAHEAAGSIRALIGLIPQPRPVSLTLDRSYQIRDQELADAVRQSLNTVTEPARQAEIVNQLLQRLGREPENTTLARTAAEVAARMSAVPAPVMEALRQWLRYGAERNASSNYQRHFDALAGAAALHAAGREVDPGLVTAGRRLAGELIQQFTADNASQRQEPANIVESLRALAPFMSPEQARTVLESSQARAVGRPRRVGRHGQELPASPFGLELLRPGEQITTEPGALQQNFGALVRTLLNSNNTETQAVALRYAANNWHVVSGDQASAEYRQLTTRIGALASSGENSVREAAVPVMERALDADEALRVQMLNRADNPQFRCLAVESFYRNGAAGLAANPENAASLLACAQDATSAANVRQHARALLLTMIAPAGLADGQPMRREITNLLRQIVRGSDQAARQQLVSDALYLANSSATASDSIAGLLSLADSPLTRQHITESLLQAHTTAVPVRVESNQPAGQVRLDAIVRALSGIENGFPQPGASSAQQSLLEQHALSPDRDRRAAAIALLAARAHQSSDAALSPQERSARQSSEQALFNLIGHHRHGRQVLDDLVSLARGEGAAAAPALNTLVRLALREGAAGGTSDLAWNAVVDLARQSLDPQGRIPGYAQQAIRLLQQAGGSGNVRAVDALGRISSSDSATARDALQSLVTVFAMRPQGDAARTRAESFFSSSNPDRIAAVSQAVSAAFRDLPTEGQNQLLANGWTRGILEGVSARELTASYAGDTQSLRTIAGMICGRQNVGNNVSETIEALSRRAAQGNADALTLLVAAAGRGQDPEVHRLAVSRLAEVGGVTLSQSDQQSPDGGMRACLEALRARALQGNEASMRILLQSACDPMMSDSLRTSSMTGLREVLSSPHQNAAVEQILAAWRCNPSPTLLGVLAAASAQLPQRSDLQRNLQQGYLSAIRREPGLTEAQHALRCQTAVLALLSNPQCLTPSIMREMATHMTPQVADILARVENVPQERLRQLFTNMREVCANPPPGTDIGALAQGMSALARIATREDVAALVTLRTRAETDEQRRSIDRALFNTVTGARDHQVRAAALEAFRSSPAWGTLTEPMRTALGEFASHGQCQNLMELRNACDRVMGQRAPYPLAVTLAMSFNVSTFDGSPPAYPVRRDDRELCQIADQIMARLQYGDSRTLSGWVLPILSAAYERYGGCDGNPASPGMILEVMRNLGRDGRLTDPRFQDLETVDRDQNVRRWQDHRRGIRDEISSIMQEMQRTGGDLHQIYQNHRQWLEAYNRGVERNRNWAMLDRPPALPPRPSEQSMRDEQGRIIANHQAMIRRLSQLYERLGQADGWLQQAQIQRTPAEYFAMRSNGQHVEAGVLLMQRWGEGTLPATLQPELQRSWRELHERGLVATPDMPPLQTAEQAYNLLADLRQQNYDWLPAQEQNLRRATTNALAERCLRVIREREFGPAQQRQLEAVAQQFQARSQALLNAFSAAVAQGRPERHLADFVAGELSQLQTLLRSEQTTTLRTNLSTALTNMRAQLRGMQTGTVGYERLQLQIGSLETLSNTLDPNGEFVRNLQTIQRGLRDITPDTPLQQIISTIAHVAVATAAFAAATAFCTATLGTGAVAVAACMVLTPALVTAGSEVTSQVLYLTNASNRSTPFMDWVFGQTHYDPQSRSFVPVSAEQGWGHLGQHLGQEALMNTLTLGAGTLGRAFMGRVLQRSGYALPQAPAALSGSWGQRFGTAFSHGYTRSAHIIGMGLAAPAIANEDLSHAMMVIGPLFAMGHSAFETARHAHRVAVPTRPGIGRPAELIEHLNLRGLSETQNNQVREWWRSRSATEQQRIAEAFRFIPPGEDVRIIQALRESNPQQLVRMLEAINHHRAHGGSPAHTACFLSEFTNLPQAQRGQLLELLHALPPTQGQALVARLSEAATRSQGVAAPERSSMTGDPMNRLVRDLLGAGENRQNLVQRLVELSPNLVAEIGTLSLQQHRLRAIETLAAPGRASAVAALLDAVPAQRRTELLRSLSMIENAAIRGQAIDRIAGHARAAELAQAIAAMPRNQRAMLELIATIPESRLNSFLTILTAEGDRTARAALLTALTDLPPENRLGAIEALNSGGREMWQRLSRLNDAQLRQTVFESLNPQRQFSPGTYRVDGLDGVEVVVRGGQVPAHVVHEILQEAASHGVRPRRIEFVHTDSPQSSGQYVRDTDTIQIFTGNGGRPNRLTYLHELGHRIDYVNIGDTTQRQRFFDAYRQGLTSQATADVIRARLQQGGQPGSEQQVRNIVEYLQQRENWENGTPVSAVGEVLYYANVRETHAEAMLLAARALEMQRQSPTRAMPTYEEVLGDVAPSRGPNAELRRQYMANFRALFEESVRFLREHPEMAPTRPPSALPTLRPGEVSQPARASDSSSTGANPALAAARELLRTGELAIDAANNGGGNNDVYFGQIRGANGESRPVVIIVPNEPGLGAARFRNEQVAHFISERLRPGNPGNHPLAVEREVTIEGRRVRALVQEHAGTELAEVPAASLSQSPLRESLRQALLTRVLFDAHDMNTSNLTVHNGHVRNIDFDSAFSTRSQPRLRRSELSEHVAGTELTAAERQYVRDLLSQVGTAEGRRQLRGQGLSDSQIDALIARARSLEQSGRFPVALEEGAWLVAGRPGEIPDFRPFRERTTPPPGLSASDSMAQRFISLREQIGQAGLESIRQPRNVEARAQLNRLLDQREQTIRQIADEVRAGRMAREYAEYLLEFTDYSFTTERGRSDTSLFDQFMRAPAAN